MSDIENDFYTAMLEAGLISEAEDKSDKDKSEKKKDKPLTNAEILYGVVPESNILEKAHPKSVVIINTYDEVNGLVENDQQRHDVMVDISKRTPKGNFEMNFYARAYQDLMNETVKLAFEMDRENIPNLMVLADNCSTQLNKQAAWPLVAVIVVGLSALYGLLYTSNNPASQGIKNDAIAALNKLKKIAKDNSNAAATLEPLKKNLEKLVTFADLFYKYNDEIVTALLTIEGASSPEEKRQAIADNTAMLLAGEKHDKIIKDFNSFKMICESVLKLIPTAEGYLTKMEAEGGESENATWFKIKKLVKDYIYNSPYADLIKILENLKSSIGKVPENINEQIAKINDLKSKTESMPEKTEEQSKVPTFPQELK